MARKKDVMSRTPKRKGAKMLSETNNPSETEICQLGANVLEVYVSTTKSLLLEMENLNREQVTEISKLLDNQATMYTNRYFDQVVKIFKR